MNTKLKQIAEALLAAAGGQPIQTRCLTFGKPWDEYREVTAQDLEYIFRDWEYRIKPEPKRRPFTAQEAMRFRWFRRCVDRDVSFTPIWADNEAIMFHCGRWTLGGLVDNLECSADGTTWQPCYVEEAE